MPNKSTAAKTVTLHHEPDAVLYARTKACLTQREAADRIGISPQLYNDIERGRRNATPANLRKIADAFNCPLVVLERKRWAA